jgi:hypothetical protein
VLKIIVYMQNEVQHEDLDPTSRGS